MKELLVSAVLLQRFLISKNWKFCFIGGIAVQRWGENRVTRDLDLTLLTHFKNDKMYIDELLTFLKPRRKDAVDFALQYRVLLAETSEGTPVDLSLGGLPFEEEMIAESSDFYFTKDVNLRTCSAESLIVLKAFASRPRDWEDVRSIAVRQGSNLNRVKIFAQLSPLVEAKEEPEILEKLKNIFSIIK